MTLARSGLRCIAAIRCALVLGIFFAFSAVALHSTQWDREGARRALEKAQAQQADISNTQEPSKNQYLSCIKLYRLVYLKDPHFTGSDDAIYASGQLYEEMGNRFGETEYYRKAAKLFEFLVSDYGTSPFIPDALLRLGNLYSGRLEDNKAAEQSFELLRTRYKNSKAALSLSDIANTVPAVNSQPPKAPAAPSEASAEIASSESSLLKPSVINGVRFWTTDEYTRVIIDMDAETHFIKARLSNPDRVYFDISNAKVSPDLLNKTFEIGDVFIKRVRLARNRADVVRVVLDLETIKSYSVSELRDPFRIIIDIHGDRPAQANAERPLNESKPRPDEVSPERSKNKPENPQKPVIQQQARNVPKEIAVSPLTESLTSSATTPVSATAKETGVNKPADTTKASFNVTAMPAETKAPETGIEAPAAKSMPATGVEPVIESGVDKAASSVQVPAKIEGKPPQDAKTENAGSPVSTLKSAPAAAVTAVADVNADKPADIPPAAKSSIIPAPRAASPTSTGDRTLTRTLGLKVGRIVIDPGHGGRDTGTIGRGGLMEKDLTLELAKKLRQLLESELGVDVVLTREEDVFLSLEERTAIANQHQADLFVSIHANSSSARSTSGVETYFLDFARNSAAREIAARENATSLGNVRDLEDLIKRIARADKSAESRELAGIVQKKLFTGARKLLPATHNRGVRSAPFVVLIGANMPSILAEVAFISNPRDESMLKKKESQEHFAKALFSGIEGYMKTLGSNVAQNETRNN
jgi:N-acetylmuramoyl-L-alanine amidase